MGLDAYFYRMNSPENEHVPTSEQLSDLFSSDERLNEAVKRMARYCSVTGKTFAYELARAINAYIDDRDPEYRHEEAYFRRFYYLLEYFGYGDEWYAKDMAVTKEQCEELLSRSKKCLDDVDAYLSKQDTGLSVSDYTGNTLTGFLSFSNTESTEHRVNEICQKHFPEDTTTFRHVVSLHKAMSALVRDIDWDNELVLFNADW